MKGRSCRPNKGSHVGIERLFSHVISPNPPEPHIIANRIEELTGELAKLSEAYGVMMKNAGLARAEVKRPSEDPREAELFKALQRRQRTARILITVNAIVRTRTPFATQT